MTSLDISNNTNLKHFNCKNNQLSSLDVSSNTSLKSFYCQNNQLTSLDVRNGNNSNLIFNALNNSLLTCINVDNYQYSLLNWINIDPQHYFSDNCPPSSIKEQASNKKILKKIDLFSRELKDSKNEILFYIYEDGTVDKKIVIE